MAMNIIYNSKQYLNKVDTLLRLPKSLFLDYLIRVAKKQKGVQKLFENDIQKICIVNDYLNILNLAKKIDKESGFLRFDEVEGKLTESWMTLEMMGVNLMNGKMSSEKRQIYQKKIEHHFGMVKNEMERLGNGKHPHFLIPTHYTSISAFHRSLVQNNYLQVLRDYFKFHGDKIKIHNMNQIFPIEIFNLTDSSLVREIVYSQILPSFKVQNIQGMQKQLSWLCRFNIAPVLYIRHCLKKIGQKLKGQLIDEESLMMVGNCLFMMERRMKMSQKIGRQEILELVQICLSRILRSEEELERVLEKEMTNEEVKSRNERGKVLQLEEILKVRGEDKGERYRKEWVFKKNTLKVLRLLIVRCDLSQASEQITECFNYEMIRQFIKENLCLGDTLAQLMYIKDKYKNLYTRNILQSHQSLLKEYGDKFKLKKYQLFKPNNRCHINRFNHVDSLICERQRLPYNLQFNDRIGEALLNDNEMVGRMMQSEIRDFVFENMREQIRYRVTKDEEYPYMADFKLQCDQKEIEVSLRDSFFGDRRPKFRQNIKRLSLEKTEIPKLRKQIKKMIE